MPICQQCLIVFENYVRINGELNLGPFGTLEWINDKYKDECIEFEQNNMIITPSLQNKRLALRKIFITPQELEQLLWEKPMFKIAEELGVSDVAIAKYAKKHNLSKPPRGYWVKI